MTCADIVKSLAQNPASRPGPEAREHLDRCPACRHLVASVRPSRSDTGRSSAHLRAIEEQLVNDLRPVRRIAARRTVVVFLSAVFLCAVAVGVYRLGPLALAVMSPVQSLAILGALVVCSSLLAWSLAGHMSPGSLHRISPGWLPLTLMVSLALVIAMLFPFHHENRFWIRIGFCLKQGTIVTILAAIPLWLILRRGAVLLPRLTGAAAGTFAGLAGATALEIHCPNIEATHILLSHLGTVVLAAASGFLLGSIMEQLEINRGRS